MAYPEYDPNEPSLGQTFADLLRGVKNPKSWQEVVQGIQNTAKVLPSVGESLGRGALVQLPAFAGDVSQTARQIAPETMQNTFGNRYMPTSEEILAKVPRMTPDYQGSQSHEMVGGLISPSTAPLAKYAKPVAKAIGEHAWNATENMMQQQGLMPNIVPRNESLANALRNTKTGEFDPRYDIRKLEQDRLKNLVTHTEQLNQNKIPSITLADFEGRPFITSMADRTAAGADLLGVNGVMYKRPVPLYGGQDYMFNNPNQVWASAQSAVTPIIQNAKILKQATGQNPIYIPWRMAPTGGDFAHMTGESMIAHAESAMGKSDKTTLNNSIKELLPSWKGVDSPQSISQYRSAPKKVRDAIMQVMDRDFRDLGGLNYGEARIAVSDPRQLNAMEGGIQNVGEIFADKPMIMHSGHPSYPRGIAGQGLGTLQENRNIFELLPNVAKERGIVNPTNPSANDLRALQMKPYAGILTPKLLKDLGY